MAITQLVAPANNNGFGGPTLMVQASGSSSYTTGGDVVTLTIPYVSKPRIVGVWVTGGYSASYNPSTGKVQTFVSGGTEVTSATNLSAQTYTFLVAAPIAA